MRLTSLDMAKQRDMARRNRRAAFYRDKYRWRWARDLEGRWISWTVES